MTEGEPTLAGMRADAALGSPDMTDEVADAWHLALLGLAGVLPDELVRLARDWLADGRRLDVARAVAFAIAAGRLAAPAEVADLVRRELAGADADAGADESVRRLLDTRPAAVREHPVVPWRFCSAAPAENAAWSWLPLDLTAQEPTPGATLDMADQAI
nr:hypothetical protein [Micromonospora sp. DSM 115978]